MLYVMVRAVILGCVVTLKKIKHRKGYHNIQRRIKSYII